MARPACGVSDYSSSLPLSVLSTMEADIFGGLVVLLGAFVGAVLALGSYIWYCVRHLALGDD